MIDLTSLQLSNDHCHLTIGSDGAPVSLCERASGREWLPAADFRVPAFSAERHGVTVPPTRIEFSKQCIRLDFEHIGFSCFIACRATADQFIFKVDRVTGPEPEVLTFFGVHLSPDPFSGELRHGRRLNTVWDDSFSVTLLSLNPKTESRSLPERIVQARAHARFGLEGAACAVLTVPTAQLDRALANLAAQHGLPQPTLNGEPAKLSPIVRKGYLFLPMEARDADLVLECARRGRFGHVMINAGSWHDRYGHYRIHPERFPGGTKAFRAMVDRFHRASIGVGIHMASPCIGWEDPYMTPVPDRRLASSGRFRLAAATGTDDSYLVADAHPLLMTRRVIYNYNDFGENTAALAAGDGDRLDTVSVELDDRPFTVRVDDELIHVRHRVQGLGFDVLQRGQHGTKSAAHAAGAEIVVLSQLYGSFLLDPYTSILDEVAESVATIYNECALDMIYFDCGEGFANPPWHARSIFHEAFLRRLDRECLVQGSDHTHHSWHWFARYGTSDCVPSDSDAHVDLTRVPRAMACRDNRMPADMGWFQLYAASEGREATTVRNVAHLCDRAAALRASISIQTSVADLKNNPDIGGMLDALASHQSL